MSTEYRLSIINPDFSKLIYLDGVANLSEPHDRSAPSDYHWKILKCRMVIFSDPSILACPNPEDTKKIHVICKNSQTDYEKICLLLQKFALTQENGPKKVTPALYEKCFAYTMSARLAPSWNLLGQNIFVHNRDFLTTQGMQAAVVCTVHSNAKETTLKVKAIKINLLRPEKPQFGDRIMVLPRAVVVKCYKALPDRGCFRSYKDLKRHWKNIHGYRLPEEEGDYCAVQFWRGRELIYPEICVLVQAPIQTPIPRSQEEPIIFKFINSIKAKFPVILGELMLIIQNPDDKNQLYPCTTQATQSVRETQAITLCTPTQKQDS